MVRKVFSDRERHELQAYVNADGLLYIQVHDLDVEIPMYITLDYDDAKTLLKELKQEISVMREIHGEKNGI